MPELRHLWHLRLQLHRSNHRQQGRGLTLTLQARAARHNPRQLIGPEPPRVAVEVVVARRARVPRGGVGVILGRQPAARPVVIPGRDGGGSAAHALPCLHRRHPALAVVGVLDRISTTAPTNESL